MSVLLAPEVSSRFLKNYVAAHVDFGEIAANDPRQAMVKRHNNGELRPMIVFLDAQGKEVARVAGLRSKEEAVLLDRFVSEKHYRKTDFSAFKAAQRG